MEAYTLLGRDDIVATLTGNSERYPDSYPSHSPNEVPCRRTSVISVYTPGAQGPNGGSSSKEQSRRYIWSQ